MRKRDKEGAEGLVRRMADWELRGMREVVEGLKKMGISVNGMYMHVRC